MGEKYRYEFVILNVTREKLINSRKNELFELKKNYLSPSYLVSTETRPLKFLVAIEGTPGLSDFGTCKEKREKLAKANRKYLYVGNGLHT